MMVTFVSQCEKKALLKTRRVLDSFANRIGSRTWQTVITQDGLDAVRKLLRKTASKNTAVACHWQRSRGRSELIWIVGDRSQFNEQGFVPVNTTRKTIMNTQDESDWHTLPLIKALTAVAALFHDWGKASASFQDKLKPNSKRKTDALRHEWVSCLLLHAFVNGETDEQWLARLAVGNIDEKQIINAAQAIKKPLNKLPTAASLIAWLMVSHHLLPLPRDEEKQKRSDKPADFTQVFSIITADFGYAHENEPIQTCLNFPQGLPLRSEHWLKEAKKWATKLQAHTTTLNTAIENGSYRLVLQYARLSLMLGDHHYSSKDHDTKWQTDYQPIANTYSKDCEVNKQPIKKGAAKQKLDEHLIGVMKHALNATHLLPTIESKPEAARDIRQLKRKTDKKDFIWQDKAVEKINAWQAKENLKQPRYGFFAVNMASTGCGKTIANAKIMQALSDDNNSLRYVLALGLRTLTLQTGDEYRDRVGLNNSELAVLIGSKAVQELHQQAIKETKTEEQGDYGSESTEELWQDNEINFFDLPLDALDSLKTLWTKRDGAIDTRKQKFLAAPVLACTIDHLMPATECQRGGRYILPLLRLMSSDLVIDEIDDFTGDDLIAIGRLIHLAGMLGRKVMISSATIPPDLAIGYYNVYQAGWALFVQTRDTAKLTGCAWIDEFVTQVDSNPNYHEAHQRFIAKRCDNLIKQPVKRWADIIECNADNYLAAIQTAIIEQHHRHAQTEPHTQKQISFGVVRIANIEPCIKVTEYLATATWNDDMDIRIMAYHAQQLLLLRNEQEKHLDAVLKRTNKNPWDDSIIRQHLHNNTAKHLIFILVATPVEEVGRDHDFDWAVVEPSSYRSIIQLAGRVLRHRDKKPETPNITILQRNFNALNNQTIAYHRPGYESSVLPLASHDLKQLIPNAQLKHINAIPRIQHSKQPDPKQNFADLEHASIQALLNNPTKKGAKHLQGWLSDCWWFTALPQRLSPFRGHDKQINLYLLPDDKKGWLFKKKDNNGQWVNAEEDAEHRIEHATPPTWQNKLWLQRDYEELLEQQIAEQKKLSLEEAAKRYGELSIPLYSDNQRFTYCHQLGLCRC